MTWMHYFGDFGATCIYLFSMLYSLLVAPIFFQICTIEHSPRNFAIGLATPYPYPVFSGLTPPVFFLFLFINYSFLSIYFYNRLQPLPRPERTIFLSHVFYPLVFHNNIP